MWILLCETCWVCKAYDGDLRRIPCSPYPELWEEKVLMWLVANEKVEKRRDAGRVKTLQAC